MAKVMKYVAERFYRPFLLRYLSVSREYVYKGIRVEVPPGIFHPGFFFSTKLLLQYLDLQPLTGRSFLELGAGSGLISLFVAKKGAIVTASDVNQLAVKCLERNKALNSTALTIHHSDLFDQIPAQRFDIIAVNPPYYRKQPATDADKAWYCGENGEYFAGFFNGLGNYTHHRSSVWMILCDGCDLDMIRGQAGRFGWVLNLVHTRTNLVEKNYIFRIEKPNQIGPHER